MCDCVCVCVCTYTKSFQSNAGKPMHNYVLSRFRHVQLFLTPWTVATRFFSPEEWNSPDYTGIGSHSPLQRIFLTQVSNPCLLHLLHWQAGSLPVPPGKSNYICIYVHAYITIHVCILKLLGCVRLFVFPWTVAYQAPPPMEFSRQEYWSGLPFPSPMWKGVLIRLESLGSLDQVSLGINERTENKKRREVANTEYPCYIKYYALYTLCCFNIQKIYEIS